MFMFAAFIISFDKKEKQAEEKKKKIKLTNELTSQTDI